jgi:hypothetical protein
MTSILRDKSYISTTMTALNIGRLQKYIRLDVARFEALTAIEAER